MARLLRAVAAASRVRVAVRACHTAARAAHTWQQRWRVPIVATRLLSSGPPGTVVSSTEILVNALGNKRPTNARQALDRIAEARSIRSSAYLAAIIDTLADSDSSRSAPGGPPDRLQLHFATLSLCESLVGAITAVDTHASDPSINPGLVVWLCQHATARQWPVDPAVLHDAAVYLACASVGGSHDSLLGLDLALAEGGTDERAAAGLALQAAVDIVDTLVERNAVPGRSPVYFWLVRALCAHNRATDAVRLFTVAKGAKAKHIGAAAAAMMSMYYRHGEAAKADGVFDEHAALWHSDWEAMAPLPVLPDRPSLEAEKWRLTHEEGAVNAHAMLLLADDLRRACSAAAPPFVRRALELVRTQRVDEAVGFLGDVRRVHHAALCPAQLDALVQALLAHRCVDQAYVVCMEYRRDNNAAGGPGAVARDVVFGAAVSGPTLSAVLAQLGATDDWSRIWSLVAAAPAAASRHECLACMQTLLAHALEGGDGCQAVRCAQQIAAIGSGDSQALASLSDEWLKDTLRQAAALGLQGSRLAAALQHTDATSHSAALREWNARIAKCAHDVLPAPSDGDTAAGATSATQAPAPAAPAAASSGSIQLPDDPGKWERSAGGSEVRRGAPLGQLERWYGDYRARGAIPPLAPLSKMVVGAIKHNARAVWEPIVRDHAAEYVARLGDGPAAQGYGQLLWSHAIYGYASLGDIEEAMVYFRRIIDAQSYPTANGTAALLGCLLAPAHPLPVIPRGWDGPPHPAFNMPPAYPPAGESPADQFLAPATDADRRRLVAETGLAMLYASLRHRIWPTQYFYCVLLSALVQARMVGELRHVFATVIPTTARKMPPQFRVNQVFLQSPLLWSIAIQGAASCGERALADYWFKEYRMSAMPLFREPASAYSRFTARGLPAYARLFILAQPYYAIPKLRRPPPPPADTGEPPSPPAPWYDLREVETQLQMDRLRALDKLPLPFIGAYRMLLIYASVDEHRSMDNAEAVADEIHALAQDRHLPRSVVPRGSATLARCWKLMVLGYVAVLQQQRLDLALPCAPPPSTIRRTQERIVHWHHLWSAEVERSGALSGDGHAAGPAALSADVVRLAHELRQGLESPQ
ncbi:hypothetical protein H4R19_000971 [Coemansia spiralis]|nr:hypothetical protein H4R19_000971 [Coemansia spiralis]